MRAALPLDRARRKLHHRATVEARLTLPVDAPEVPPVPSRPRWRPPLGACDTHAHVLGPFKRFPVQGGGAYLPPLAPYEAYRAMLERVGMTRGVLVQAAVYRLDHGALLDALSRASGDVLGVGLATGATSDEALADMLAAGIRGFRFVEVPDPVTGGRYRGSVAFEELEALAPRIAEAGMHGQVWAECDWIAANRARLEALGIPVVVDHMGRFDAARGVDDPAFRTLRAMVRDGTLWVKLAVCRTSPHGPDYEETRPFHDALVEANPDRLLWGSDWPHIRLGQLSPDVGRLIDLFDEWVGDESLYRKILVDNPRTLYGFS